MSGLRIEPVAERDVPVLHRLIRELAEYEQLVHLVVATEDQLRDSLFGRPGGVEAVLARVDGQPAGYALWFYTYSTFLGQRGIYLEDLFVVPSARGKGVGRALMAHLAQVARAQDCGRIEWAVLNWNEPAIRFYEGLGAQPIEGWTIYRLDDGNLRAVAEKGKREKA